MSNQPSVADYLKFCSLQVAAEALLNKDGLQRYQGEDLRLALLDGNNRVSRFAIDQARDFADHWVVVEQKPSTGTGFSGTLFRCVLDDPATGAKAGELVLSFRSTEFIDDAARDNKATNELEIARHGFAFGQLRDMEAWVATLSAAGGPLHDKPFSVTGYSLGGHLASAFNLMHGGETLTRGQPRVRRV